MALLLLRQAYAQVEKLQEQLRYPSAACIVTLNERFELLGEVGSRPVELYEPLQLGANCRLERLNVGIFVARLMETACERREIDFGEIQRSGTVFPDRDAGDRAVELRAARQAGLRCRRVA